MNMQSDLSTYVVLGTLINCRIVTCVRIVCYGTSIDINGIDTVTSYSLSYIWLDCVFPCSFTKLMCYFTLIYSVTVFELFTLPDM